LDAGSVIWRSITGQLIVVFFFGNEIINKRVKIMVEKVYALDNVLFKDVIGWPGTYFLITVLDQRHMEILCPFFSVKH